jgi:hypothetical protein
LIVHGTFSDDKYVIAFNKDLFVFQEDDIHEVIMNVLQHIRMYFPEYRADISLVNKTLDVHQIFDILLNSIKDIVCAKISNDTLIAYKGKIDHRNSLLTYKIMKQFDLQYVYDEDVFYEEELIEPSILERFPSIGFHGTSSTYLTSILRTGLNQTDDKKNWPFVTVEEIKGKIYFTTHSITALFHANRTTKEIVKTGVPVIIEFEIPDKNRIEPDRDVIRYTGIEKENGIAKRSAFSKKPLSLSKEIGIYAYRGKIPPSFIKAVWIPTESKTRYEVKDFIRKNPKEAVNELGLFSL